MNLSDYKKFFVVFAVLLYALFGSASTLFITTNGEIIHCPFMGEESMCSMDPLEHIAAWQHALTATVRASDTAKSLASVFVLATLWIFREQSFAKMRSAAHERWRLARRVHMHVPFLLQQAYARGILNPKLF